MPWGRSMKMLDLGLENDLCVTLNQISHLQKYKWAQTGIQQYIIIYTIIQPEHMNIMIVLVSAAARLSPRNPGFMAPCGGTNHLKLVKYRKDISQQDDNHCSAADSQL